MVNIFKMDIWKEPKRSSNVPEKMFLFTQDEKTLTKLMSEIQEAQEGLNKHKAESNVCILKAG